MARKLRRRSATSTKTCTTICPLSTRIHKYPRSPRKNTTPSSTNCTPCSNSSSPPKNKKQECRSRSIASNTNSSIKSILSSKSSTSSQAAFCSAWARSSLSTLPIWSSPKENPSRTYPLSFWGKYCSPKLSISIETLDCPGNHSAKKHCLIRANLTIYDSQIPQNLYFTGRKRELIAKCVYCGSVCANFTRWAWNWAASAKKDCSTWSTTSSK